MDEVELAVQLSRPGLGDILNLECDVVCRGTREEIGVYVGADEGVRGSDSGLKIAKPETLVVSTSSYVCIVSLHTICCCGIKNPQAWLGEVDGCQNKRRIS